MKNDRLSRKLLRMTLRLLLLLLLHTFKIDICPFGQLPHGLARRFVVVEHVAVLIKIEKRFFCNKGM